MQRPTPRPFRDPWRETADDTPRAPAEARSFAPVAARGLAEARARWPAAWETLAPERIIRLPGAPDRAREDCALIVIPCLNEASVIARVIARILDDDGLVDPMVLVVDGGSTDGSQDVVGYIATRDPRVRLLPNPQWPRSGGVNLAARSLAGDRGWMVRVDVHAEYPRNYVSTLIAEAKRTGATSVVVAAETRGKTPFQRATAAAQNSRLAAGGAPHRMEGVEGWVDHGHHALFRLDAFEAVGGYDESFSNSEDAELDLRLTQDGGRIWLTDRARIVYHPRKDVTALWRQYFSYGRGRARTVLKHGQPLSLRHALALAVAPAVASLVLAPLYPPFAIPALVWVMVSLSYGAYLGWSRRDRAAMASGLVAMVMHLAWSAGFWTQFIVNRPTRGELGRRPKAVEAT